MKKLSGKDLRNMIIEETRKRSRSKEAGSQKLNRNTLRKMILREASDMGLVDAPKEEWPRPGDKVKDVVNKAEFSVMKVDKEAAKLVSHSCANHVLMESSDDELSHRIPETQALGKCVWHALDESGRISHYDVKFGNKLIKNIPASRLIVVTESNHTHETRSRKKSKK
jgi:hypothetical protein